MLSAAHAETDLATLPASQTGLVPTVASSACFDLPAPGLIKPLTARLEA